MARTFQDLILTLQTYWARQGCVIVQPLDMEVGAGTFHWATFLRSIGESNREPLVTMLSDNQMRSRVVRGMAESP